MKYLLLILFSLSLLAARGETFVFITPSHINGKTINTQVSEAFINNGGEWKFGSKLPVDLNRLREIAKCYLNKKVPKLWTFQDMSFYSYDEKFRCWLFSFTFCSESKDEVTIQCNLKGEIWPLGKIYDVFDE